MTNRARARPCRSYRPTLLWRLEGRITPSLAHPAFPHVPLAALGDSGQGDSPVGTGPTITVGVLGDSYSDEYAFYPPDRSQARNWVEILANTRGVDFGTFSKISRGSPRRQGFADDWALSGTDSAGLVALELPGLVAQVAQGGVPYVSLYIGANDFYHVETIKTLRKGGAPPSGADAMLQSALTSAEANVSDAVQAVLGANPAVKLVVVTLPPVTFLPLARGAASHPRATPFLNAIDQVVGQYDAWLADLAAGNPRVALADFAAVTNELAQQAAAGHGAVDYGGARIAVTSAGDSPNHLFLADEVHLGTVGQGMLADTILAALDAKFGANVPLLSPPEVVRFARQVQAQTLHGDRLS